MKELSWLSASVLRLLEYAQRWQCPSSARLVLDCLREFVRRAADEGLLSEEAVYVAGELDITCWDTRYKSDAGFCDWARVRAI